MNLQNKKKKLSIRVVIHPCKASAAGVYSLAIRVLYCRKKKEYSLGWRVHESNYRRDADRVVYSSEGILTRREVSLVNRLIRNEKEDLVRNYRLLERTDPGFTLERLMLKHRKEQYNQSVDKFILQYIDTLLEEGKQSTAASYTSGLYSLLRFCSLRKINFNERKGACSGTFPSLQSTVSSSGNNQPCPASISLRFSQQVNYYQRQIFVK